MLSSERTYGFGNPLRGIGIGGAAALIPRSAEAHVALESMGSFWSGAAHLLTSLDQLCFLVALAIWMSFLDRRLDARAIGLIFAGIFIGAAAYPDGRFGFAGIIAALMAMVGLAGAIPIRIGAVPVLGIASVGGMIGGAASASGMTGLSLGLFSLGGAIAGASVLSYGLLAARRIDVEWGRIALRAVASWIAAAGLMLLALSVSHGGGRG
jgi:hydrogenase/urease accessory protein HupE